PTLPYSRSIILSACLMRIFRLITPGTRGSVFRRRVFLRRSSATAAVVGALRRTNCSIRSSCRWGSTSFWQVRESLSPATADSADLCIVSILSRSVAYT
ncbi:hypothetical protein MCOR05_011366, partial [Pyricularia oryzae]